MQYFRAMTLGACLTLLPMPLFAQGADTESSKASTSAAGVKSSGSKATAPTKGTAKTPQKKESADAPQKKSTKKKSTKKTAASPGEKSTGVVQPPSPPAKEAEPKVKLIPRDDGRVAIKSRAPSTGGPTGLDRVWSADTGPLDTIRMRLGLSWFDAGEFPAAGSSTLFIGTDLALAYTPHELVEIFAHTRGTSSTNDGERPSLLQSQGDLTLGTKVGGAVSPSIRLAGATSLRLMSGMGGGGFQGDATSFDVRFLSTFDLTESQDTPLRIHMDWGYYLENSESIVDDLPGEPSLIQEFGLQTARYDRLTLGLGLESPFEEYVGAFLEYTVTLPILVELSRRGAGTNDYSFDSVPHSIALGIRGTPVEHLAIDAGIRVGLSGSPHTGVPATPPYQVMFGLAYTLDPRPKLMTKIVEKPVKKAPEKAAARAMGDLRGRVVDAKTKKPISGAEVAYVGQSGVSPQLTASDGTFGGYAFKPGPVGLRASAKGYKPGRGKAMVKVGGSKVTVIALEEDPAQKNGKVKIWVLGKNGKPIRATVNFGGKALGISGATSAKKPMTETVPAGQHPVTVLAKGYPELKTVAAVRGGEENKIRLRMQTGAKPSRSVAPSAGRTPTASTGPRRSRGRLATVSTDGITLKKPITFNGLTAELTGESKKTLDEVARGLIRVTSIKRVRVASHVTGVGTEALDARLSIARARAVKTYLSSKGVKASRLQARGYGGRKPVASSLTSRGRTRNERIEFDILR